MPLLLRAYGAMAAAATVFAVLVLVFGAPRSREQLALTAATFFLAIGALFVGYFYAQALAAAGARRWVANLVLVLVALSPAVFLFLMPRGGPIALAITTVSLLLVAHEPKSAGAG
jgi:hypothetical protein